MDTTLTLTERSAAIRRQGEAEAKALGVNYPAYRVRLGGTYETVFRGIDPRKSSAFANAEVLETGEACIRRGQFCEGCSRCRDGLIAS